MAINAAFFRAALTEDPISDLLSRTNFSSEKSSCRALADGVRFLGHGFLGFFNPHDQEIFVGHLLQVDILKPALDQGAPDLVQAKGLLGLELGHGAAPEFHPQVGLPAVDLHKGHQADKDHDPGKGKGIFSQIR